MEGITPMGLVEMEGLPPVLWASSGLKLMSTESGRHSPSGYFGPALLISSGVALELEFASNNSFPWASNDVRCNRLHKKWMEI